MKTKVTITVDLSGWVLFCPIWLAMKDGEPMPIPRGVPDWVLDAALGLQQFRNYVLSYFGDEYSFFHFSVKRVAPVEVSFYQEVE